MQGRSVTVTATRAVLVDGSGGSAERPVRAILKAASSTVYLGGADVDASTKGYPLVSTDAPLTVVLTEHLYAVTASGSVVVNVLASGE